MLSTSLNQVRALFARQELLNQQQNKRLARKIHDEISQKMTVLALQLSMAASDNRPPVNWVGNCKDWAGLVMDLGKSVREITHELQPRILDEFGLTAALRWLAQSSARDICCDFIAPNEDVALAPFAANELFGICREIVTDILVPARVARVEIELEQRDGAVRLHLRANDDRLGRELITERTLDSIAIRERLLCLDGTADLNHSSDAGSVVTLSVPATHPMACAIG